MAAALLGTAALLLAACGNDGRGTAEASPSDVEPSASVSATANGPASTASATAKPSPTHTQEPQQAGPTDIGDTAWREFWYQATGVPTQDGGDPPEGFHIGHVMRAGTLEAGETLRIELPEPHAFADGPRGGRVLTGGDDGQTSTIYLADARTGETTTVMTEESIVWGGTLAPDGSAMYHVPVDRGSMTDIGLWRTELAEGAEAEQVLEQFNEGAYDFASQVRFAWSPDGEHLVGQYCNRDDCHAHVLDVASGEAVTHDEQGVFELRGATNTEYVADAFAQARVGILAVDLETLEVREIADEWGTAEVRSTPDGPMVVYLAPTEQARHVRIVGIPLEGADPRVVYEDRQTEALPEHHPKPGEAEYEPPSGWLVLWPGPTPPPDAEAPRPTFLALEIGGEGRATFPYPPAHPQ